MNLVRKGALGLLSLVLLIALLGGALATSADLEFAHPNKLEATLKQSNFYTNLQSNAIAQAAKSGGNLTSFNDPAVHQAAQSAVTTSAMQSDTEQFISGNYSWLQGKTPQPRFNIDLTPLKEAFANNVAAAVRTRLSSLPRCTTAQLLAINSQGTDTLDPFTIDCRPLQLDPQTEANLVSQDILNQDALFNGQSTITPTSFGVGSSGGGQPFYQKLSFLPKLYRLLLIIPWICLVLVLLSVLGVLRLATSRRRGWRRIGFMLLTASVILATAEALTDWLFHKLESKVLAGSDPLQHSITDALNRAAAALIHTRLWFIAGYLLAAAIIFILLKRSRPETKPLPIAPVETPVAATQPPASRPQIQPKPRPKRPPKLIQ